MLFVEILLWIVVAAFLVGLVMTLERRLPSVVGLFIVCCTSIFFVYYFSFSRFLAICVLFSGISLIAVRYLFSKFQE